MPVYIGHAGSAPGRKTSDFSDRQHQFKADNAGPAPTTLETFDFSNYQHQLIAVERTSFKVKKPVNAEASRVLKIIENTISLRHSFRYRVFPEISLGAFLATEPGGELNDEAWRSINPKRADFLIVDPYGHPVFVLEYHGTGHHLGENSDDRFSVKRKALEKAGVELVEVQRNYDANVVRIMIEDVLQRYEAAGKERKTAVQASPASMGSDDGS
jgi:hypothetical protein